MTIPNNSLVDLDDILYQTQAHGDPCCNTNPSNSRPDLHDGALLCVTDLEDCCDASHTVHGDWYYPDGQTAVPSSGPNNIIIDGPPSFLTEVQMKSEMGGSFMAQFAFFGWSGLPERGRFRCELPSAADPSVTKILYGELCIPT